MAALLNQEPAKIELLVLQPTAFCNINCSYCYLPDRHIRGRMPEKIVEDISQNIISTKYFDANTLILWHAGEPLAVSSNWYRAAHETFSRVRKEPIRFQFQTNGTLINDQWGKFFSDTGSSVGVSIDGPSILHDYYRKDYLKKGTLDRTLEGISYLQKYNVPFTVISTITDRSLDFANELFDFMHQIGPSSWGLSIEEAEGANSRSTVYNDKSLQRISSFFRLITERNFLSPTPLRIREIDSVLGTLMGGLRSANGDVITNQEIRRGSIVSVGMDGSVSLFSPELLTSSASKAKGIVGNITQDRLDDILHSVSTTMIEQEILAGVELCKSQCDYFDFCGGGSPANKLAEHGRLDVAETWQCKASKQAATQGILSAIAEPSPP